MVAPKRVLQNSIIGDQGIALIHQRVAEMGFLWHQTGGLEAGIDGYIEIRDLKTGAVFNSIIQVQSKATAGSFAAETPTSFHYICDERDLNYWLSGNAPVILIVSRPSSAEAYWVNLKQYFADVSLRKSRKVLFDKDQSRFDKSARDALAAGACSPDVGLYLSPEPKSETVYSNLLKVAAVPDRIFVAETPYRRSFEIRSEFKKRGEKPRDEYHLWNKRIVTFHDPAGFPWNELCDAANSESFRTNEWSVSDNRDRQNCFLALLNGALRQKCYRLGLVFNDRLDCFHFRASTDLEPHDVGYRSLQNETTRTVFEGYKAKADPDRTLYYRHSAFQGKFVQVERDWYLTIEPSYVFTSDGFRPFRYHEEYLSGKKRLERNSAVLGSTYFWSQYLTPRPNWFNESDMLEFDTLLSFPIQKGIRDEEWLPGEEDEGKAIKAGSDEGWHLFK